MIKTMYTKDAKGAIRFWCISASYDGFNVTHGLTGTAGTKKRIDVERNQSGRSLIEQIHLEMRSRISKQYDKGYVNSREEAENMPKTNALGLIKPMLATPIANAKNINYTYSVIQRKYNGHRCLVHNNGGIITAYSRNGKPIETIDHITYNMNLPENCTLDGELYVHGELLQSISSLVKKAQEGNKYLNFVAYDNVIPDVVYRTRLAALKAIPESPHWGIAETYDFIEGTEQEYMEAFVKEGYEGAIIRLDGYGYEDSKRSKGLLKVKPKMDGEFIVTGITRSRDGWAVLHCKIPWESSVETFKVSAPGTIPEKHEVWDNLEFYVGKLVTVEYYELTKAKVPFHPVALYWRDKGSE